MNSPTSWLKAPLVIGISMPDRGVTPFLLDAEAKGWPTIRLPAIDLRDANREEVLSLQDGEASRFFYGHPLTGTQLGCTLTHAVALERFLASDQDWALILEEDARAASRKTASIISDLCSKLDPGQPTVVSLYSRLLPRTWRGGISASRQLSVFQSALPLPGTVAYLISRAGACHAVEQTRGLPVAFRADWPSWITRMKFKFVYPWPFLHDEASPTTMHAPPDPDPLGRRVHRYAMAVAALGFGQVRPYYRNGYRQFIRHLLGNVLVRSPHYRVSKEREI